VNRVASDWNVDCLVSPLVAWNMVTVISSHAVANLSFCWECCPYKASHLSVTLLYPCFCTLVHPCQTVMSP
jgi:hypothetical protein